QLLDEILRFGYDANLVIGDFRFPGDELDGIAQAADLVHEAELEGLAAGIDAPARQLVDRLLELLAANGDHVALEDSVDVVHPGLHAGPLAVAEHRFGAEHAGIFAAL